MPGPRPTPTATKRRNGNPGKRPLNEAEPQPPADDGDCPDWITGYAREFWVAHAPILRAEGLFTVMDRAQFTLLAQTWGFYREGVDKNQHDTCRRQALLFHRLASEFGFSPSSRVKLVSPKKGEESALKKILEAKTARLEKAAG